MTFRFDGRVLSIALCGDVQEVIASGGQLAVLLSSYCLPRDDVARPIYLLNSGNESVRRLCEFRRASPGAVRGGRVKFSESTVEGAALESLDTLGWQVARGTDIAPDTLGAERADYGDVVLERRLRDALSSLNPSLPTSALDDALRRLTRSEGATLEARNRWQVLHGSDVVPYIAHAERAGYGQVFLNRRMKDLLAHLNLDLVGDGAIRGTQAAGDTELRTTYIDKKGLRGGHEHRQRSCCRS